MPCPNCSVGLPIPPCRLRFPRGGQSAPPFPPSRKSCLATSSLVPPAGADGQQSVPRDATDRMLGRRGHRPKHADPIPDKPGTGVSKTHRWCIGKP
jgi:hypothetical protein